MEVIKEKPGICTFQIVKYGVMQEPYNFCYCCSGDIRNYTFGMITIVAEAWMWCYKCAVSRLEYEPELQDFIKSLVPKEDNYGYGC